jgi:hypothetical protein
LQIRRELEKFKTTIITNCHSRNNGAYLKGEVLSSPHPDTLNAVVVILTEDEN